MEETTFPILPNLEAINYLGNKPAFGEIFYIID
jgi:hypothetical protein